MPSGIPKNGINTGRFKKGLVPWNKGKKGVQLGYWAGKVRGPISEETREKHRMARAKQTISPEHCKNISKSHLGKKNPGWKGGITPVNRKGRKSSVFREWRSKVFSRDNWTCQKTQTRGGILHPHHILNFAQHKERQFDIDNGITLSENAHKEFHRKYGRINNTKEQLLEFLNT